MKQGKRKKRKRCQLHFHISSLFFLFSLNSIWSGTSHFSPIKSTSLTKCVIESQHQHQMTSYSLPWQLNWFPPLHFTLFFSTRWKPFKMAYIPNRIYREKKKLRESCHSCYQIVMRSHLSRLIFLPDLLLLIILSLIFS